MRLKLESWLEIRRIDEFDCRPSDHPGFVLGRGALLRVGDQVVAEFGEAAAELTADMRLKSPLYIAIVELDKLWAVERPPCVYHPLPQFPAVSRDISLVADTAITNQQILEIIRSARITMLEKVELFDIYEDEETLGAGRRSLAYSLTYRDARQTLTDKRVNGAHERIRRLLAEKLPVELR